MIRGGIKTKGFTIVELLIVVVVIAVLASIAIVGYTGVSNRAKGSAIKSNLSQSSKKLEQFHVINSRYPVTLEESELNPPSDGISYDFRSNGSVACVSGATGSISYRITTIDKNPVEGACEGWRWFSSCPTGYVVVSGSILFGTPDFCVMKYEAKNVSGVATSVASGAPWTSLDQDAAIRLSAEACDKCHLLTEQEWMTIALNILSTASNWSGGSIGSGYVYQGHINNNPASALAASTDDTAGTTGITGGTGGAGLNNRRTHTLSTGEVIWDISGNVGEYTRASVLSGQYPGVAGDTADTARQWNNASLTWGTLFAPSRASYLANVPTLSAIPMWTSAQGIGQLYTNLAKPTTSAYVRGGSWSVTTRAGVLGLDLSNALANTTSTGFRVAR